MNYLTSGFIAGILAFAGLPAGATETGQCRTSSDDHIEIITAAKDGLDAFEDAIEIHESSMACQSGNGRDWYSEIVSVCHEDGKEMAEALVEAGAPVPAALDESAICSKRPEMVAAVKAIVDANRPLEFESKVKWPGLHEVDFVRIGLEGADDEKVVIPHPDDGSASMRIRCIDGGRCGGLFVVRCTVMTGWGDAIQSMYIPAEDTVLTNDEIDDRIAWVRPDAMSWTQPVGCDYADRFEAGHPAKGAALPDEIAHKVDDINHWRQCMAAGFDDHKHLTCSVWSFGKFEAEIVHSKGLAE